MHLANTFKREIPPEKQFHTKTQAILTTMNYLETYYNYDQV